MRNIDTRCEMDGDDDDRAVDGLNLKPRRVPPHLWNDPIHSNIFSSTDADLPNLIVMKIFLSFSTILLGGWLKQSSCVKQGFRL
jgi:hypothetical protein